jgi:hypothetical protein
VGVEAHPGHARETPLAALVVRGHPHVYPARPARDDALARLLRFERQPELARQDVRRPQRDDPQRGFSREAVDDLVHRAVAAGGDHDPVAGDGR